MQTEVRRWTNAKEEGRSGRRPWLRFYEMILHLERMPRCPLFFTLATHTYPDSQVVYHPHTRLVDMYYRQAIELFPHNVS